MFSTKGKKKQFRKRKTSSSDSESDSEKEDAVGTILEDTKAIQSLRKRAHGVDITTLGKKVPKTETPVTSNDPYKLETGGMVDMKAMKTRRATVEEVESIGTMFAAETNRRDEDADMFKYVEEELAKRKGLIKDEDEKVKIKSMEDALYEVPEHLRVASVSKKTEDMLSNQMLSGIPEVDLGIDAKIKNIEATEEAKQALIRERLNRKEKVSDFVPTNMAVNFVQHNRFNIEDTAPILKANKPEPPKPKPVRVGDMDDGKDSGTSGKKSDKEKATDDYHYEKFKKQVLRR